VQQLRDGREPLGEVMPTAAVDDHLRAYLVVARIGLQGGMKRKRSRLRM